MPSMKVGLIGLGKMGGGIAKRLVNADYDVVVWGRNAGIVKSAKRIGAFGTSNINDFFDSLDGSRVIWLMVPASAVEGVLRKLMPHFRKGDIVVDGGNSYFKNSMKRAELLRKKGIFFLDIGISGGPVSIKMGKFAIMVGGEKRIYKKIRPLLRTLSDTPSGYMGPSGAGHFAKMVHNGIEYGMMQALAEGFTVLKKAPFKFRLKDVAEVYNNNSIITSRLVGWLKEGFKKYGENLKSASGTVAHTGEGEWTVKTARELKVPVPIIKESFKFRVKSKKKQSFTGKILSTLRAVFGGHNIK